MLFVINRVTYISIILVILIYLGYNRQMQNQHIAHQLEALGNGTRLQIFRLLTRAGDDGANVGTIQRALAVPGSTLTHHITRLVAAGLVSQHRHGRELICHADFQAMDDIVAYLTAECCLGLDDTEQQAS